MSIDNGNVYGDNETKDVDDEYEVIRLDGVEPLNDPDCKHFFIKDSDTIGGMQAWICKRCKRGKFYPIGTTIINS